MCEYHNSVLLIEKALVVVDLVYFSLTTALSAVSLVVVLIAVPGVWWVYCGYTLIAFVPLPGQLCVKLIFLLALCCACFVAGLVGVSRLWLETTNFHVGLWLGGLLIMALWCSVSLPHYPCEK